MLRFFPVLLLFLLPVDLMAETAEEQGLAIATEADRRDTGFGNYTSDVKMILRNKQGQESVREIRSKTLEVDGDHISVHTGNPAHGDANYYPNDQGDHQTDGHRRQ